MENEIYKLKRVVDKLHTADGEVKMRSKVLQRKVNEAGYFGLYDMEKAEYDENVKLVGACEYLVSMSRRESVEWRKIVYSVAKGKIGKIIALEENARLRATKSLQKLLTKSKNADLINQLGFSRLPDIFKSGIEFNRRYRDFMEEVAKSNEVEAALGADEDDVSDMEIDADMQHSDEKMDAEINEVEAVKKPSCSANKEVEKRSKCKNTWSEEHYKRVLSLYQD